MTVKRKTITNQYHIVYPLFLLLFLTVGLFSAVYQSQKKQELNSQAATATKNCTVSSSKLTIKAQEQRLFGEINLYRVQHSLDHLIWSNTLKQSAAWQSSDMAAHNKLSHVDSLNRSPDIRLANCGYDVTNGYGENIAQGANDDNAIFSAWKNDPPHNKILLNSNYNIAGIDVEVSSNGTAYWTMDFGASSPVSNPHPTSSTNSPLPTLIILSTTPPGSPSTGVSNPNNSQTPSQISATQAPVSADMLIAVQVKINGIGQGGNTAPKHLTRRVRALVYGTGTDAVTTGTGYLTYDGHNYFTGTIHLGKLSQGAYFIKLVSDNTLQVLAKPEFQNLIINRINQIQPITLYLGDMNGDNILNIDDYNLVLPCFQDKNCQTASTIDFNDDGKTDVKDYNLFLQSFEILHGN